MTKKFLAVAVISCMIICISRAEPSRKDVDPVKPLVEASDGIDSSARLAQAIRESNALADPKCIYLPSGVYVVKHSLPMFSNAGCVKGDGSGRSVIRLDKSFSGDLFSWSEAWAMTKPGPRVSGLTIIGDREAKEPQNALVFYDRVDELFLEDIDIINLPGRAFFAGAKRFSSQSFLRESRIRSVRLYNDGTADLPVFELTADGKGTVDATNEVSISQVDIYASSGPSFVIRNNGQGAIRLITVDGLRIEGKEKGDTHADLLNIGDTKMRGGVNTIFLHNVQLIDPYPEYAAFRVTGPAGVPVPYHIQIDGIIGGGLPYGKGIVIERGRSFLLKFVAIHTLQTNVTIGEEVSNIVLDGGGYEHCWSYKINPKSRHAIRVPVLRDLDSGSVSPSEGEHC